jgi:hypothetical protein
LEYAACLHAKYRKPVRSVVLCPFETNIPDPPYVMTTRNGKRVSIVFDYNVVRLWQWDARQIVRERRLCLYALLPAMQYVDVSLLKGVLAEMRRCYSDEKFGPYLNCFCHLVMRSTTMAEEQKKEIKEVAKVQYHYNWFFRENPDVDQLLAAEKEQARKEGIWEGKVEGLPEDKIEGLREGRIEGLQEAVVHVVKARFPQWVVLAQQRVQQIHQAQELEQLMTRLVIAPDESVVLKLLQSPPAS